MTFKTIFVLICVTFFLFSCRPNIKQLFAQADDFARKENFNDAIKTYNQIIKRDSTIQLAYFKRGVCYSYIEQDVKAIMDFNKVMSMHDTSSAVEIEWNKNSPFVPDEEKWKVPYKDALYKRAVSEYLIDSIKQAFVDFNNAMSIGYEPKSDCHRWIGLIYVEHGQKEKGCELLKKAILEGDTTFSRIYKRECQ